MNPLASPHSREPAGWLQPLGEWPLAALRALQTEVAIARVVVATVRGSAPREAGTCMLVTSSQILGTIGGGRLEWEAIQSARSIMTTSDLPAARLDQFTLATDLAQCCGGVVELWIERYTRSDLPVLSEMARALRSGHAVLTSELDATRVTRRVSRQFSRPRMSVSVSRASDGRVTLREALNDPLPLLYLYGAGHVGQALVKLLAELPVRVRWIDSRPELLPTSTFDRIEPLCVGEPVTTVAQAPPGTHFLVMTHCHSLDYSLSRAALERNDTAFVGLIGSKSKAARFRSRLGRDGVAAEQIARLTCPIGIDGLDSKLPAVIAVAIAAQLLQEFDKPHAVETVTVDCHGDCTSCGRAEQ